MALGIGGGSLAPVLAARIPKKREHGGIEKWRQQRASQGFDQTKPTDPKAQTYLLALAAGSKSMGHSKQSWKEPGPNSPNSVCYLTNPIGGAQTKTGWSGCITRSCDKCHHQVGWGRMKSNMEFISIVLQTVTPFLILIASSCCLKSL
jgi:hypothetical protein